MLKKLKYQLLLIFLFYTFIAGFIAVIAIYYNYQKDRTNRIINSLTQVHILFMEDLSTMNQFFTYEVKNPEYYIKNKSPLISKHHDLIEEITSKIVKIDSLRNFHRFNQNHEVGSIEDLITKYNQEIIRIFYLIKVRGYKDNGIEGEMDYYISMLENYMPDHIETILNLRQDEKNFIIRTEYQYVHNFHFHAKKLKEIVAISTKLHGEAKDSALYCLRHYVIDFDSLVVLDFKTGIKNNSGLKLKIDNYSSQIESKIEKIISEAQIERSRIISVLERTIFIIGILTLVLGFLLSFVFSKKITHRISSLTKATANFVQSGFTQKVEFPFSKTNDEIGLFIENFKIMSSEITSLVFDFQQKVTERTDEVIQQKDLIGQQNEELLVQNEKLEETNQVIEDQKSILEEHNKYILDSIRYARKIQSAILPEQSRFNALFPENFIFYKPKDIISGDFYWVKEIKNNQFDITVIAVGDCTGHGVPGALMSMLGIAYLNEIVMQKNVTSASQILDHLKEKIVNSLSSSSNEISVFDGMDLSVCVIHNNKSLLEFSGANRPLYIVRNGEMIVYKGNSIPIGIFVTNEIFINHKVQLEHNDQLYMFTDGFASQFGGANNRKFMARNFRNLLLQNSNLQIDEQHQELENTLNLWKGASTQVDDILVVGFKYQNIEIT